MIYTYADRVADTCTVFLSALTVASILYAVHCRTEMVRARRRLSAVMRHARRAAR